jgi:hypothetical protein
MMIKKSWFDDEGSFSEENKNILIDFNYGLGEILGRDEIKGLDFNQLYTLRESLCKLINQAFDQRTERKFQRMAHFQTLTDLQFEEYLVDKYGTLWPVLYLNYEEVSRLQTDYFREKIKNFK